MTACRSCGKPTRSRFGFCTRTAECRRRREQARYAAPPPASSGPIEAAVRGGDLAAAEFALAAALAAKLDANPGFRDFGALSAVLARVLASMSAGREPGATAGLSLETLAEVTRTLEALGADH